MRHTPEFVRERWEFWRDWGPLAFVGLWMALFILFTIISAVLDSIGLFCLGMLASFIVSVLFVFERADTWWRRYKEMFW